MATRCSFENSNDIGVFCKLTNAYCLVALGASENLYRSVSGIAPPQVADELCFVNLSVSWCCSLSHCLCRMQRI